jgi:hypothetical protein
MGPAAIEVSALVLSYDQTTAFVRIDLYSALQMPVRAEADRAAATQELMRVCNAETGRWPE